MLFVVSIICVYWFQPISTIRTLDFWLPSIILGLGLISWGYFFGKNNLLGKNTIQTISIIFATIVLLGLSRLFAVDIIEQFVSVPKFHAVVIFILTVTITMLLLSKIEKSSKIVNILLLLASFSILVILKYSPLTEKLSELLRRINGQSVELANAAEITWIGFSYFIFRLLHVFFEQKRFRSLEVSLKDYLIYLVFFPAFTAGPIARLDQFLSELNKNDTDNVKDELLSGGLRICKGLFYKFIIADSLAIISIGVVPADQVISGFWLLMMIYAFAIRIFMDFAGYTDISIGISNLLGIKLPENFERPYFAENITIFWNRWHITLTQWFRTYYFNPTVRFFRTLKFVLPSWLIIFFGQITTMLLIALWHGISLNYIIWGIYNGLGLFIHNRWTELINPRVKNIKAFGTTWIGKSLSIFVTFNYISLGWVWFASPDLDEALLILKKLFGLH